LDFLDWGDLTFFLALLLEAKLLVLEANGSKMSSNNGSKKETEKYIGTSTFG
jgi:hypothetical protein